MSQSTGLSIDYDALAAALLRGGYNPSVTKILGGEVAQEVAGVVVGGVEGHVGGPGVKVVVDGVRTDVGPDIAGPGDNDKLEAPKAQIDGGDAVDVNFEPESDDSVSSVASSAVSGGTGHVVSPEVRKKVQFGGFADFGGVERQESSGFFRRVVRGAETKRLKAVVEQHLDGVRLPKAALQYLAVCAYTSGTMPDSVVDGKKRLRTFAAIGDAAITLHIAVHSYVQGKNVESAQVMRNKVTSDAGLRQVAISCGLSQCVVYAPGVDPGTAKTTATAYEAVVGVLSMFRPHAVVAQFLTSTGVLR